MAYMERTRTWKNLGTDVEKYMTSRDVLQAAGIDYDVVKTPCYHRFNGKFVNDRKRKVWTMRQSDGFMYDTVSPDYEVVQNRDAFSISDDFGDEFVFEKAGELHTIKDDQGRTGGLIYVIGRLPEVRILGDSFVPYLIIINDFMGKRSIRVAITTLRLVCENQLQVGFGEADNTQSIRHTKSASERLDEAKKIILSVSDYMKMVTKMAEGYAAMKVSPRQIGLVMDAMFPVSADDPEEKVKKVMKARAKYEEAFSRAYDSADNYVFRGTAWGLVNAYTDLLTHKTLQGRATEETRFQNILFAKKKNTTENTDAFLNIINDIAA